MAGVGSSLFLIVKWSGNEYKIELDESLTVLNLKNEIKKVTDVLPERQKLMGLKFKGEKYPIDIGGFVLALGLAASELAAGS